MSTLAAAAQVRRVDNNTIVVPSGLAALSQLVLDKRVLIPTQVANTTILHGSGAMTRNLDLILRGEPTLKTVNGTLTQPGEIPWQVALIDAASVDIVAGVFCGGVLIGDRWVLTAAHCMTDSRASKGTPHPSRFFMVTGATHLDGTLAKIRARNIWVHDSWQGARGNLDRDIALIELERPLATTALVRPVDMPPSNDNKLVSANQEVLISGWGYTADKKNSADLLRANLSVVDTTECSRKPGYSPYITGNMFCAYKPGVDACANDSGGPAISTGGNTPVLVGLTSFGFDCAGVDKPGVYVRVSRFLTWIRSKTGR